jgi:hypothetical protein
MVIDIELKILKDLCCDQESDDNIDISSKNIIIRTT